MALRGLTGANADPGRLVLRSKRSGEHDRLPRAEQESITMTARRILAALLALSMIGSVSSLARAADPPPPPPAAPPAPDAPQAAPPGAEVTPARVSYLYGEVSFWRPGAEDWAPAKLNTPLAPGDVLFAGPGGNVEVQIGPRAFVRASDNTQL